MRCGKMRCGNIWRCGGPKKGKKLLSYEEIVALTCDDAAAELNTAPTEYYSKFSSEGHLFSDCLSDDGTALRVRDEPSSLGVLPYIEYSDGTWRKRYPYI